MPGSSGDGGSEPTFYETLGVGEDASAATIRAAYRERAKETHPDVSDDPDAGRRFRRVKRAHDVLTDGRERRRYDRIGHEAYVSRDDGPPAETDPSDASAAEQTAGGPRDGPTGDGSVSGGDGGGRTAGTRGSARTAGRSGSARSERRTDPGGSDPRREASEGRSRSRGSAPRSGRRARSAGGGIARVGRGAFGRVAYGLGRWLRLAGALVAAWQSQIGPAGAAIALATFAAYPVLLASSVTPLFPLGVNLLVAFCTVSVLGYLVVRPAVGVAVLGTWLFVLPIALTVSGVGVLSLGGVYAIVVTVVPLVLCVATLAGVVA